MSYSDPPPPPPQYGAPQPPYGGQPAGTNSKAVWSLVLGILGLVCCGIFTGIPAMILASKAKKENAVTGQGGTGMATAGFVLGIVSIAFSILGIILFATGAMTFEGSFNAG